MPWRKRAKLLDALVERLKDEQKPLQSLQVVALVELLSERILASVRFLMVIATMLFVMVIGLEIQIQMRNRTLDDVQTVVHQATDPKSAGAKSGADAIKQIQETNERVQAIEFRLCGGPCPTIPKENK